MLDALTCIYAINCGGTTGTNLIIQIFDCKIGSNRNIIRSIIGQFFVKVQQAQWNQLQF